MKTFYKLHSPSFEITEEKSPHQDEYYVFAIDGVLGQLNVDVFETRAEAVVGRRKALIGLIKQSHSARKRLRATSQ